jgi:hypothetical protein
MPHGWSGFSDFDQIDFFAEQCSSTAVDELRRTWFIAVIDLMWGRADYLWESLSEVLAFSEKPHPDLGLDIDFAL